MCQAAKESCRCGASHQPEWLSYRREARDLVGGRFNIIEAHDGDIAGYVEAGIVKSADAAHGSDVIEAKDCGELLLCFKKIVNAGVTDFRGR